MCILTWLHLVLFMFSCTNLFLLLPPSLLLPPFLLLGSTLLQSQTLLQQKQQPVTVGQSRISPFYQSSSTGRSFYSDTPSPAPVIKHTVLTSEPARRTSLLREPVHYTSMESEPTQLIVKIALSMLQRHDSAWNTQPAVDHNDSLMHSNSDDHSQRDINDTVSHGDDTSAPYIAQASDTKLVIRTRQKLSSESSSATILSPSGNTSDHKVRRHKSKKKKKSNKKYVEKTPPPPITEQSTLPLKLKITVPRC